MLERLRRLAENASGLLNTRLALFSLELQEEAERQLGHFLLVLVTCVLAAFCLLFLSVFALVLGWQAGHPALTAGLLTLGYGVAAALCGRWVYRRVRGAPTPFAATLAEFELDRRTLQPPVETES